MNNRVVAQNFDRSVRTYDRHASVQRKAGRLLLARCPAGVAGDILELGSGTGLFTEMLVERYPGTAIDALDLSGSMVESLRARFGGNPEVSCRVADAELFEPDRKYGLVVSNAVFHWFSRMEDALAKYQGALLNGGVLAFTAFGPETFRELREALRAGHTADVPLSSSSFRTAEDYRARLEWLFPVCRVEEVLLQENYASLLDLLRAIKRTGTRGYGFNGGVPWSRKTLHRVEESYRDLSGGISATFQLFVCRAGAS